MLLLLIDENFNHRILRGLIRAVPDLDYVIAQNCGLKGSIDPVVLAWAAERNQVVVTHDVKTLPHYAYERVRAAETMRGVIAVPDTLPTANAIEDLALIVECASPADLENRVVFLPLR